MRLFGPLYDRVLRWAAHPKAPWYLGGLSFAESSFFPIPPDVMLAPMALARPDRAWRLALLTTLTSVAGGLLGYAIGYFALEAIEPWLVSAGYWEGYLQARDWFETWGFWAVLAAGFSPIPYKMFTVAAGALAMFLPAFVLASIVGRGGRFFLVAGLIRWGGAPMEQKLRHNVEFLGWLLVALLLLAWFIVQA
ncbi:YqaA family protein [Thioalkalivibrio sp. XN279]|uniref:YqaA family protein n=1 Tax=Thioalkalivibrio sp. XN279 TaxID=2714953 RepID=UPI001408719B|nr:YqaA family protein [Thioalkalivibrio sp. XN279]NHA15275.1 DedA family protein [Thioalkalivibrio sp. XN279]